MNNEELAPVQIERKEQMTLDEFVKYTLVMIQAFQVFWKTSNQQEPEDYQIEMQSGDWDEQFSCFCEAKQNE